MHTPWGKADLKTTIADGIDFYSTPSHGGFKVSKAMLVKMSVQYRNADGWYEEDCESAKVVLAFPNFFTSDQVDAAAKSFTYWFNIDGTSKKSYD